MGTFTHDRFFFVDNQYLKYLVEVGFFGFLAMLFFFLAAAWTLVRRGSALGGVHGSVVVASGISALVYALVSATFDAQGFPQVPYLLYIIVALGVAILLNAVQESADALAGGRVQTMSIDVSVVVVTYNSEQFLPGCLGSIAAAVDGLDHEVIIVDNASADATRSLAARLAPEATLLGNPANVGFGVASNQGLRAGHGKYMLLLNPDAALWPGSVATLVAHMEAHPECGIAGPQLHDADGAAQCSIFNFPTPANQFFESLFLHRLAPSLTPRFGEVVYDRESYGHSHSVGWVSGATMLLRSSALVATGLFDERYFMYSEEKDLCYRMNGRGWTVDYVADAHATHGHDGHVTPEAFARQLGSKLLYFDKHYRGWYRIGCKTGLALGFATRVSAGALAALVRSSRSEDLLVPVRGIPLYLRTRHDTHGRQGVTA